MKALLRWFDSRMPFLRERAKGRRFAPKTAMTTKLVAETDYVELSRLVIEHAWRTR